MPSKSAMRLDTGFSGEMGRVRLGMIVGSGAERCLGLWDDDGDVDDCKRAARREDSAVARGWEGIFSFNFLERGVTWCI